jgi:hypothetical protein
MAEGSSAGSLVIENNQLFDICLLGQRGELLAGIHARRAEQLEIAHNAIRGCAEASLDTQLRGGIVVQDVSSVRVTHNDLTRIGPAATAAGTSVGILVFGAFGTIDVQDNRVQRAQLRTVLDGVRWQGIVVLGIPSKALGAAGDSVSDGGVVSEVVFGRARYVAFSGERLAVLDDFGIIVVSARVQSLGVRGNLVEGEGEGELVEVRARATVILSDNRVVATIGPGSQRAAMLVGGSEIVASANWVRRMPSTDILSAIHLLAEPRRMTVLGNIVEGGEIRVGSPDQPLGSPWAPLNVRTN